MEKIIVVALIIVVLILTSCSKDTETPTCYEITNITTRCTNKNNGCGIKVTEAHGRPVSGSGANVVLTTAQVPNVAIGDLWCNN